MDYGIRDRVILVTGGASGIGFAIAQEALTQGALVALIDSSTTHVEQALGQLHAFAGRVVAHIVDVRDAAAVDAAVDSIETLLGPIAGLAASAGVTRPQPAALMTLEAWDLVIDVNLTGVFNAAQAVGRRMIKRGRGSIVAISSTDGFGGHAARAHYSASKHGVLGLIRSLAIEWGRHGVRVNAVAPGVVDTPLLRENVPPEHVRNAMLDRVPLGRFSHADEQAHATLFFLSDAASYISGAALAVDGGLTAGYFTHWGGADLGSKTLLQEGLYGPDDLTRLD